MPIRIPLLQEIQTSLGMAVTPSLTPHSAASDIYEAYILSLVLDAAKREGATISYQDVFGKVPTTFVFRTSPGHLFSRVHPYTHAVLTFPSKPSVEAHIGVRVFVISKVLHECDVAVITSDEAETCRQLRVSPRYKNVILAVECKFYACDLPLHLARSFMGLTKELRSNNRFFVLNIDSLSATKMLSHHHSHGWEHQVVPASTVAVERLKNVFQNVFKNYKAT